MNLCFQRYSSQRYELCVHTLIVPNLVEVFVKTVNWLDAAAREDGYENAAAAQNAAVTGAMDFALAFHQPS